MSAAPESSGTEEAPASDGDPTPSGRVGDVAQLTPMLRHYLSVKQEHPGALVLYRMGDFYELFFEDAVEAAPILEVALTARQKGTPSEAPMCGVPHHSIDGYIGKLLEAGRRVAVCDQVEDPAQAKGLVRREVTRVLTPGTVSETELLEQSRANYLASISSAGEEAAAAFLDLSTGEFFVRRWPDVDVAIQDLERFEPRELLSVASGANTAVLQWLERRGATHTELPTSDWPKHEVARKLLERQLKKRSLRGLGFRSTDQSGVVAAGAALRYARDTALCDLGHIDRLEVREAEGAVTLDESTLRNLEVFRNQRDGGHVGSLCDALDRTRTGPGARLLKRWIGAPLRDRQQINDRLDSVEELVDSTSARRALRDLLREIADLERLGARAVLARATPREIGDVRDTLGRLPDLWAQLRRCTSRRLAGVPQLDPATALHELLSRELSVELPAQIQDGGFVAEGVDAELDDARSLARDAKSHLAALEAEEREATGIGTLKVRYNRVFGYFLEVTKSQSEKVPERFVRKQTLANAERFFTPELKELEERILQAEATQAELEQRHFERLRAEVAGAAAELGRLGAAIAEVDVLASFADVANRHDYCRPRLLDAGTELEIEDGRHPIVERTVEQGFVPNDTTMSCSDSQVVLLTGPNMGGKSTYLRQVALIGLLAHVGSFVPARSAKICLLDRIFTRVGASDDLSRGESTFMVEMIETANILRYATASSLVVLDEVGRGTSTFDGLSLAWAIAEDLHDRARALTLFATHYHELTELAQVLGRVRNHTMSVREWEDDIVFLHRVVEGSADKSYGLHVARLAGVPDATVKRAAEILRSLESQEYDLTGKPRLLAGTAPRKDAPEADQLALFARPEDVLADVVREVDIDRLTPLAALNLLDTLKRRLSGEE